MNSIEFNEQASGRDRLTWSEQELKEALEDLASLSQKAEELEAILSEPL